VNLPYIWTKGIPITLTKLEADGFGNTSVEATVYGVALKPWIIPGVVVGPNPGQAGFDDVRARIEQMVTDQIADALQAVG
jgi:hypothetical protein